MERVDALEGPVVAGELAQVVPEERGEVVAGGRDEGEPVRVGGGGEALLDVDDPGGRLDVPVDESPVAEAVGGGGSSSIPWAPANAGAASKATVACSIMVFLSNAAEGR